MRSFCAAWYSKFSWLDYWPLRDAVTCFPCVAFSDLIGRGFGCDKFSQGWDDWKQATVKERGKYTTM